MDVVLEDEEGLEYEAVYIPERTGISGGWRAFALDHKLDDGDAVVFERTEAARFKVGSPILHLVLLILLLSFYRLHKLFSYQLSDCIQWMLGRWLGLSLSIN